MSWIMQVFACGFNFTFLIVIRMIYVHMFKDDDDDDMFKAE